MFDLSYLKKKKIKEQGRQAIKIKITLVFVAA